MAAKAAREALEYLAAGVPVGPHLADQLILPLALSGGGSFRTVAVTPHFTTNAEVIRSFGAAEVRAADIGDGRVQVDVA